MSHAARRYIASVFAFAIIMSALIDNASAHGDLHEQIQKVTEEIKKTPRNALLYLKRGELYRFHEEWKPAMDDFDMAEKLDPDLHLVVLARGRTYADWGKIELARSAFEAFLKRQPSHAEAHVDLARTLAKLKDFAGAEAAFERGIALHKEPEPQWFNERAECIASQGSEERAIQTLDEALQRFGGLITMREFAIHLEVRRKNFSGALRRIDEVLQTAARKEKWYGLRGDILLKADRQDEARESFRNALAAIDELSEHQRKVRAIVELRKHVESELRAER